LLGFGHLAGETCARALRRGPALAQGRHDARAQEAAVEAELPIGRVVDPLKAQTVGLRGDLGARKIEQRSREEPRREHGELADAHHASHAGAAQHPQQHCFELIVPMVGRQHDVARCDHFC